MLALLVEWQSPSCISRVGWRRRYYRNVNFPWMRSSFGCADPREASILASQRGVPFIRSTHCKREYVSTVFDPPENLNVFELR